MIGKKRLFRKTANKTKRVNTPLRKSWRGGGRM